MNREIVYFGIPLISRSAARDWSNVTRLFNNTLASIYNQKNKNFKVLVACHNIPEINSAYSDKTIFLTVDHPVPKSNWDMMLDKGVKKAKIGQYLHSAGGGYQMFMDADDLVHRDLVDYVLKQQHPHGYLIKQGYELDEGKNTLRKVSNFDQLCGSCGIIYFYPEDLPSENNPNLDGYFDQFRSHSSWEAVAAEHDRLLSHIPFEAAVYVRNTGENHSARLLRRRLKQKLLFLFENKTADEKLRQEFSISLKKS